MCLCCCVWYVAEGRDLDLVELSAIYASLPEKFTNDTLRKQKEAYLLQFRENIKMAVMRKNSLSRNQLRHPAYLNQVARFENDPSLHSIKVCAGENLAFPSRKEQLNNKDNFDKMSSVFAASSEKLKFENKE